MGLKQYNQAELIKDYELHVERLSEYTKEQLEGVDLNAYTFPLDNAENKNLTLTLKAWENVLEAKKHTLKATFKWVDKYKLPFKHDLNQHTEGIFEQLRYVMEDIIQVDWDVLDYDVGIRPDEEQDINEDLFHHRRNRLGDDNA